MPVTIGFFRHTSMAITQTCINFSVTPWERNGVTPVRLDSLFYLTDPFVAALFICVLTVAFLK